MKTSENSFLSSSSLASRRSEDSRRPPGVSGQEKLLSSQGSSFRNAIFTSRSWWSSLLLVAATARSVRTVGEQGEQLVWHDMKSQLIGKYMFWALHSTSWKATDRCLGYSYSSCEANSRINMPISNSGTSLKMEGTLWKVSGLLTIYLAPSKDPNKEALNQ